MDSILNKLIGLNIELEGALRVAANRPSQEALENAKRKFAEISALFAMLDPKEMFANAERKATQLKEEEAEAAEMSPMDEPDLEESPSEADEHKPHAAPASERNIFKMLTLNDKFLFKRELFGNNEGEMNVNLNLIASMHSIEEAKEYIFEDLRWDADNRAVKDFLNVIGKFFTPES